MTDSPVVALLAVRALDAAPPGDPVLSLLAFGERAQAAIPKARDWMNNNSWVVSEAVIALFVALTLSDLV